MSCNDSLALARSSTDVDGVYNALRDSVCRKAELMTRVTWLRNKLSTIVRSWTLFETGDIRYFQDDTMHSKAARKKTLRAISGVYTRLQMKLETLESLTKQLGDEQEYVSAYPIPQALTELTSDS